MSDTDHKLEALENSEWLQSLADLHSTAGPQRVKGLLEELLFAADKYGKTLAAKKETTIKMAVNAVKHVKGMLNGRQNLLAIFGHGFNAAREGINKRLIFDTGDSPAQ